MNVRPILYGASCCLSACSAALLVSACVATDVYGAGGRHIALATLFGAGAALIVSLIAAHRWLGTLGLPWAAASVNGLHRLRGAFRRHKFGARFPLWIQAAPAAHELVPQGPASGLHLSQVEISRLCPCNPTPGAGAPFHHSMNRNAVAFYWQWESMRPQPDPMMTRERAARLLRAWRHATTQGARVFKLKCVRNDGTRAYLVQHVPTGESGGLYIKPGAGATSEGFAAAGMMVIETLARARLPEGLAAGGSR